MGIAKKEFDELQKYDRITDGTSSYHIRTDAADSKCLAVHSGTDYKLSCSPTGHITAKHYFSGRWSVSEMDTDILNEADTVIIKRQPLRATPPVPFQYSGDMPAIEVPDYALTCAIHVRHAMAEQVGKVRVLTLAGVTLCEELAPHYDKLVNWLKEVFALPVHNTVCHGIEVMQTALILFNMAPEYKGELDKIVSMKKIPDPSGKWPNWLEARKAEHWTMNKMILYLAKHKELLASQPLDEMYEACRLFHFHTAIYPELRVVTAVHNEPTIGLFAKSVGAEDSVVGADYGKATLVFLDEFGDVVSDNGVQKFAPPTE